MGRPHLTNEQRAMALRLRAKGLSFTEIAAQIDSSVQTAWNVIMRPPTRTVLINDWSPGPGRLTLSEREEISLGLRCGETFSAIAKSLDRNLSTVSREVAANGARANYRAWRAHDCACRQARRP